MRFRYVMAAYAAVWALITAGICIYEWNALKRFQAAYDEQEAVSGAEPFSSSDDTAQTKQDNVPKDLRRYIITADSTMSVYINGVLQKELLREEVVDVIYDDLSQLLGREVKKYKYTIEKERTDIVEVKDSRGNVIRPVGNDFVKGACIQDDEASAAAVKAFEHYLKHVSGLVTFEELTEVMKRESKAYAAVRDSQPSLKWMIKAKSIEFTREDVSDIRFYDEQHFSCELGIDLVKISDTEYERRVEETVNYIVLFERAGGKWMISSFVTK